MMPDNGKITYGPEADAEIRKGEPYRQVKIKARYMLDQISDPDDTNARLVDAFDRVIELAPQAALQALADEAEA
jgi:hypothetical protein